jgi:hypothetical protein
MAVAIIFAIADHPWTDGGAAVTIAMTSAELNTPKKLLRIPQLGIVINQDEGETPEDEAELIKVELRDVGKIFSNLQAGVSAPVAASGRLSKLWHSLKAQPGVKKQLPNAWKAWKN